MIQNPRLFFILALLFSLATAYTIIKAEPYNVVDSKEYAILSGIAYCPKKCLQSWTCKGSAHIPISDVTHVNNALTLAAAFIGFNSARNQIVASFRGSANIQNWIQDFTFQKIPYNCKGCEIHSGFLGDYLIIEQKINEKISSLISKHPTASILATGHSLGGALAQIAGLKLKAKFNKITHIQNFGCPRVGNAAMAQYIATHVDSLYRVIHNKDIVPHLPPEAFQFHHSAFQVFFNQGMDNYVICNQSGEDKTCSNKYAPEYSAADHSFYFMDLGSLQC